MATLNRITQSIMDYNDALEDAIYLALIAQHGMDYWRLLNWRTHRALVAAEIDEQSDLYLEVCHQVQEERSGRHGQ